ncbi:MAG: amino acid ABC transporter substrate-binding protein [Lachnospiraceae bacterium]|nr:amino acid ABC transporter substrate-binding protein [Lachnospiraceae bacterium]
MKKKFAGIVLAAAVAAAGSLAGCSGSKPAKELEKIETTAGAGQESTETDAGNNKEAESKEADSPNDSLTKIQKAGVLKIGTEGTYSPYSYHDEEGNLVGFDVEIARLIAEKLGVKAEFVETKWDAMIAGLDAKRFDIIANQVGITQERKEKYDFSEPYTYIHGVLIVGKDNEEIKAFEDLAGKKSAQTLTSNWGQTAEGYGAELVGVDGFDQSIELITSKRADATINSQVALYDYLKQKPDAPVKVVATAGDPSIVGIPVRKGEDSLYKAVNQAILELKEDGTLTELSLKYFGVDITQE